MCKQIPKDSLLTYLITYLLTPWSTVLLEKLTGVQVKKFPALYGTRKFITAFTSARHLSLSWASSIQSIPLHPTSWRSIVILSSHLCLGLPSGLFPSGFPTKPCIRLSSPPHTIHAPPISFFLILSPIQYWVRSADHLAHYVVFSTPVTSSLLRPNILLYTLFSNTLSLRSSLSVGIQISHPYKTTGKIIVLYIIIFKCLDSKPVDKRFCTTW